MVGQGTDSLNRNGFPVSMPDHRIASGQASSVPVVGLARWAYSGKLWEVRLGVVWFDAPERKMEMVWQIGEGDAYHYAGDHWTARERFYVYPMNAPYTDIGLDMMALGEMVTENFPGTPLETVAPPLDPPPSHDLYSQGGCFGGQWALFFVRLPHWLPLMRAGWFWRPGPDGLEKIWHRAS